MDEQILIQDILKHLAECEYDGQAVTLETLAGRLRLSPDQLDSVIHDLESADLVAHGVLELTRSGKEYALHVLRAHRLYETYLAQKTGVSESQWHTRAHVKEHTLSTADVEKLARDLDYPRFDPHGDPIPTETGAMPPKCGQPLMDYPAGWEGRVFHVEDEPPRLYALIAAAGIGPGTVLRIDGKTGNGVKIFTEGRTFFFSTDAALQITAAPLADGEEFDKSLQRLSSLDENEEASVAGLSPRCLGLERSRLLDLGVVPGTAINVDLVSPSGSPIAYRIRGASIALRHDQAERVLIHKI